MTRKGSIDRLVNALNGRISATITLASRGILSEDYMLSDKYMSELEIRELLEEQIPEEWSDD